MRSKRQPIYGLYIFDLDGTLFRGQQALPHAVETVTELRRAGAAIRYVTNNSSQTRAFFAEKLRSMGFPAEPHEIHSSATATATYLESERIARVFVIGEPGLKSTLQTRGVEVGQVGDVVVGICKTFSYELMNQAMQLLSAGARFIATNTDATYPVEDGKFIPGAGSIVAAVTTCSGREPVVIGKPNPTMIFQILEETGVTPGDTLVIGDRVDTDLLAGERAGTAVHLVLTGVTEKAPPGTPFSADLRGLL